jgi:FMN phosphatase YigB (HAD superfamily)
MIISEQAGLKKPNPGTFQLALNKARKGPWEAWMVGDRADINIGPSRSLGMRAIRVIHDSEASIIPPNSDLEVPDYQFADLNPLTGIF